MAGEILDSGNRRQFYDKDGKAMAVRDMSEDKGREDLLPLDIISQFMYYIENDYKLQNIKFTETLMFDRVYHFMQTGNNNLIFDLLIEFINKEYDSVETAIMELAKHYEKGAIKYAERNWEKGLPCHSFVDSGLRHGLKYFRGDQDEPHNRAFMWNFFGLLWTIKHHPDLNDLPYKNKQKEIDEKIEEYKKNSAEKIAKDFLDYVTKEEDKEDDSIDLNKELSKEVHNTYNKTLYLCCYFELEERAKLLNNLLTNCHSNYITICCNGIGIRFNYDEEIHINSSNNAIYIQESILIKKGIIFEEGKHIDPDKFYVTYPMISSFKKFEYKILEF